MSFSFPTSPSVNQLYTFGNKTWKYNGTGWILVTNVDVAQTAWNKANLANVQANTATVLAQGAYNSSNTKLSSSGGTITGSVDITQNLSVTGNLTVLGSSTSINTASFTVNDTLLVLGLGNYTSDILDIGFASHYNNGSNAHTGLIRDASEKRWMFFEGYTPEVSPNNDIVITDPSFKYSNVRVRDLTGNLIANTVVVNGVDLFNYTTNSYTQANTATNNAAGASLYANGAFTQSNAAFGTANSAALYANASFVQANAAYESQNTTGTYANSAFSAANTATNNAAGASLYANGAFTQANAAFGTANSAALYANAAFLAANNATDTWVRNQANAAFTQANAAFGTANSSASYANGAFTQANSAYNKANNALANTTGTFGGDLTISGNLIVTGANVALGNVGSVHIYGGNTGQVLVTDNQGNLSFIDLPTTNTTSYTASTLTLTNGVYVSGSVTDTQVLNDGNAYQITDGSNTGPAWIITTTFTGVVAFNRLVTNIDYTASSGHTIYFQIYNNTTSAWDNLGSYSGASGYSQYALEVLEYTSYISSGTVQVRLYHSNTGNVSHTTKLDYLALQLSAQGAQGPRGATGATGATGSGVATGGTAGQILVKNSSTNYDTSWSSDLINAYAGANSAGSYANSAYTQANTATNNAAGASLYANAAFIQANAAFLQANTPSGTANSAALYANAAFTAANTADSKAVTTGSYANSAYTQANTAVSNAAGASLYANGAFVQANAGFTAANTADSKAVTAGSYANSAFGTANSAAIYANAAFLAANSKFNSSGGTITGDTIVTGNLTVTGTRFYANTVSLIVEDNIITLNSNVTGTPTQDSGIEVNRGTSTNTSILWKESVKSWQFTNDGTNYSNIASSSAETYANGAFSQANAAYAAANAAGSSATVVAAFIQANSAYGQANSAALYANAAFLAANNASDSWVRNQANSAFGTANSAALYANASFVQANAAFNAANNASDSWVRNQANAAFAQANAAFAVANTGSGSGGTLAGYSDSFTANGATTTFTLSTTPSSANITFVAVQGVLQPKSTYSLTGNILTFDSTPPNTAIVEVTTLTANGISTGGSSITWSIVSIDTTMTKGSGYFVDTTTGPRTMTLPTTATLGDTIRINDLAGTFSASNLTVARNGHKIQGTAADLTVNVDQSSFGLVYSNSTYGWKVLEL